MCKVYIIGVVVSICQSGIAENVQSSVALLYGRDAPGLLGRFFLWKNDKGDDIIIKVDT